MTAIWIAIIAAGLAIFLISYLAKKDLARIAYYEGFADAFYERIQPVVDDPETPDEVLDLIETINKYINQPIAAQAIVVGAFRRRVTPKVSIEADPADDVIEKFFLQRRELFRPFVEGVASGLMAISYSSRLFGWFVRSNLKILQRHAHAAPVFAEELRDTIKAYKGGLVAHCA